MNSQLPRGLREVLAAAIAELSPDEAAPFRRHYHELMPAMRAAQHGGYFDVPLDWSKLPRLSLAIDRLFELVILAAIDPIDALGAPDAAAFRARSPDLATLYARTHYGAAMPLLYGYPADLAYFASRGLSDLATIDRYFVAPIIHELCHFARERTLFVPLHLDECIGGYLGVHVHPEFAYPAPGHDDAIFAAPAFAQIGQAIVRAFGMHAVIRTHAGVERALPSQFLDDAAALARCEWLRDRPLHFLSRDPDPWLALIDPYITPDPAADRAILEDALRAMCLSSEVVNGSYRTRSIVPTEPIVIRDRRVRCAGATYWLPPTLASIDTTITVTSLDDLSMTFVSLVR